MPIAKITGRGLTAIGFSVALLWSCVIVEHVMSQRAQVERASVLREMRSLQRRQRSEPVSLPSRFHHRHSPVTAG